MNVNQLAEKIFNEGKYKALCIKLAGSLGEDLHSEFIEAILKGGEGLDKAYREQYIDVYCVGTIHNIWGKRDRHKQNENGQTSPLFNYTNTFDLKTKWSQESEYGDSSTVHFISPEEFFSEPQTDYDFSYDYKYTKAEKLIENEKDHPDISRRHNARIYYYSYCKFKNAKEFSRESGLPYRHVVLKCKEFKEFIKNKLKI